MITRERDLNYCTFLTATPGVNVAQLKPLINHGNLHPYVLTTKSGIDERKKKTRSASFSYVLEVVDNPIALPRESPASLAALPRLTH